MARTISVPDFDFAGGFYYGAILELLIKNVRTNVPEITNEDPGEAAIQLLSAFALVGHLNNVRLDLASHEALMVLAQLRDSLVAHLKLIGFKVDGDIPARVELTLALAKTFTGSDLVVPDNSRFSTRRRSDQPVVDYEADADYTVTRTDQIKAVKVYDASAGTYTDIATQMNTDSSLAVLLPAVPAAGDILYIGHDTVMTDQIRAEGMTISGANYTSVWEYSDTNVQDEKPDSVTVQQGQMKVIIDSLLDTDGAIVYTGLPTTITHLPTGASEVINSLHDGTNNYILTTGFIGQTTPSTNVRDYSVGAQWQRLDSLNDGTNNGANTLQQSGEIKFSLPKSQTESWEKLLVDGETLFWIRLRVISVTGTPVAPNADRIKWDKGTNYIPVSITQGRTRSETLGSSDVSADQKFTFANGDVIPGTDIVSVDAVAWTRVENFLNSKNVDENYTIEFDSDGKATVKFGDGVNGKIPPTGTNNIAVVYRTGANADGNVGSDIIIVNAGGIASVKRVTNPKPATGWVQRRGTTPQDRERLKLEGPADLRALGRAVTQEDTATLTKSFKNAVGDKPFVRAKGTAAAFGDKTIKVTVVGPAGAATSTADRAELEKFFNGEPAKGTSGIIVANQRAFVRDYIPKTIAVTAVVTGGSKTAIDTAVNNLITPIALNDDGLTFRWDFGQKITTSAIIAAIFRSDDAITDVALSLPSADVILTSDELPAIGTLNITVI